MTTDEFFESCEATKLLVENLKCHLEVLLPNTDTRALMRANLIAIKQCLQDCGYSPKQTAQEAGVQK